MEKYEIERTEKRHLGRFEIILDTVKRGSERYPYSYISMKNSVGVLGFYNGSIILIKQYRHALGTYEMEIPGGGLENGEEAIVTAKREMEEETGYKVSCISELGVYYPSPGSSNEVCTLFLAECYVGGHECLEPLEYIETFLVSKEKFKTLIVEGKICHSMALIAWLYYEMLNGERKNVD